MEELQVSISYLSWTNQATLHNNAMLCYDRIIIALENLVARQFGMPEEIGRLHGVTLLAQMKYYVSTALGISEDSYAHLEDSPVYGTGQGSCASPSIWLQICSILFNCYFQCCFGAYYESPDGETASKTGITGFVDNTKGQTNYMASKHPMPLNDLLARMQSDAQLWGDLLHVTGGALETKKCNYYIMKWKFKPSRIPELKSDVQTILHLENGHRTGSVALTNDAITIAHKTLGTWKSAQRDQVKQIEELSTKSNKYARTIMASPVAQGNNWTAYHTIYLPKMTFVLLTSYIPEAQLKKANIGQLVQPCAKGGFISSFPRAVVFGPQRYGGIAMRPEQTKTILKHLHCAVENQAMLRIMLAWAQLETGMGFALLERTKKKVPHLECVWLQSNRTGLSRINSRIKRTEASVYKTGQSNNCHLMDQICESGGFTNPQIRRINACRLYLKVTFYLTSPQPAADAIRTPNSRFGNRR
jgi:hypothetical protein